MSLQGKKVLVLGLGDTGLSMTRWLARQGAVVSVADTRAVPPHAQRLAKELPQVHLRAGAFQREDFEHSDMIAVSPGIDPRAGELADAIKRGTPVAGDVELFARALREQGTANAGVRVIAVTGSNGKSTVTEMCGDMCKSAGLDTVVAGNIGLPVLDVMTQLDRGESGRRMPDAFVLELSSFQLETTCSLEPDAATVLNLSEDHMDRYDCFDDYVSAKARIFAGMDKKAGVQVLNRDDERSLKMARSGRKFASFGFSAPMSDCEWGLAGDPRALHLARGNSLLMPVAELPLAGLHNAANALAAGALCHAIGVRDDALVRALRAFKGLPHRVQRINQVKGIDFFDDSKGTNVGATVAALNGMRQPVVLIAGGDGKAQDFSPLTAAVAVRARAVVLIGRDAPQIAHVLESTSVPLLRAADMSGAIAAAYGAAQTGDAVLLSPACASYDMFRNYIHRAEVFAEAVAQLARRVS
jgi:UDP-N-acetylmuramoylalanine--D-glutamate ligase